MDLDAFSRQPIMGILRGITQDEVEPLVSAVIESGLETVEIAMNTPGSPALIRRTISSCRGKLTVGAGTVLNMEDLRAALDAGAAFIVTPVLIEEVVAHCVKNRVPVFPGALTPDEIYGAWKAGASMVKVFPANVFGPGYFKEVKGPFNDVKLLACGGVNPQNLPEYFSNGASAVAFGSSVFSRERLIQGDYISIIRDIRAYLLALEGAI